MKHIVFKLLALFFPKLFNQSFFNVNPLLGKWKPNIDKTLLEYEILVKEKYDKAPEEVKKMMGSPGKHYKMAVAMIKEGGLENQLIEFMATQMIWTMGKMKVERTYRIKEARDNVIELIVINRKNEEKEQTYTLLDNGKMLKTVKNDITEYFDKVTH